MLLSPTENMLLLPIRRSASSMLPTSVRRCRCPGQSSPLTPFCRRLGAQRQGKFTMGTEDDYRSDGDGVSDVEE